MNNERYYPTAKDAAYWTDLGYTLVSEIVCGCGFANKVQDEWHSGFFRAECGGCSEELALHSILRAPNRTQEIIKLIDSDTDGDEVFPIPIEMKKELEKYARDLEKMKPTKSCDVIHDLVNFGELRKDYTETPQEYIEFTIEPPDGIMDSEADEKDKKNEKFSEW